MYILGYFAIYILYLSWLRLEISWLRRYCIIGSMLLKPHLFTDIRLSYLFVCIDTNKSFSFFSSRLYLPPKGKHLLMSMVSSSLKLWVAITFSLKLFVISLYLYWRTHAECKNQHECGRGFLFNSKRYQAKACRHRFKSWGNLQTFFSMSFVFLFFLRNASALFFWKTKILPPCIKYLKEK